MDRMYKGRNLKKYSEEVLKKEQLLLKNILQLQITKIE
jgi:hypothetical protein